MSGSARMHGGSSRRATSASPSKRRGAKKARKGKKANNTPKRPPFDLGGFEKAKLPEYNALRDSHLRNYFGNKRVQNVLVKAGLIAPDGSVLDVDHNRQKLSIIEQEFMNAELDEYRRLREEQETKRRLLRRKQLLQEEEERRIRLAQIKAHRKERQAELMESSKWSHILSSRTTSRSRSRSPSRRGPSRRRSAGDGLPSSAHNTHDFLDRMENFEVVDPSVQPQQQDYLEEENVYDADEFPDDGEGLAPRGSYRSTAREHAQSHADAEEAYTTHTLEHSFDDAPGVSSEERSWTAPAPSSPSASKKVTATPSSPSASKKATATPSSPTTRVPAPPSPAASASSPLSGHTRADSMGDGSSSLVKEPSSTSVGVGAVSPTGTSGSRGAAAEDGKVSVDSTSNPSRQISSVTDVPPPADKTGGQKDADPSDVRGRPAPISTASSTASMTAAAAAPAAVDAAATLERQGSVPPAQSLRHSSPSHSQSATDSHTGTAPAQTAHSPVSSVAPSSAAADKGGTAPSSYSASPHQEEGPASTASSIKIG